MRFLNCHVLVKQRWELMRVRKRVCLGVVSTVMLRLNKDERWWELRSESLHESFLKCHVLVKPRWELMRDEKREFAWEFRQLSCSDRTKVRVEKRESLRGSFLKSQLSCPGQTKMRNDELRRETWVSQVSWSGQTRIKGGEKVDYPWLILQVKQAKKDSSPAINIWTSLTLMRDELTHCTLGSWNHYACSLKENFNLFF